MATTPDEWLPILTKRLDDAYPRIKACRDYANGRAPLPEMGANTRASWLAFQRKARTNYGGLCIQSLSDRMQVNGVVVGGDATSEASARARLVWRDNRMDVQFADAKVDALTTGRGFLVVGLGADGRAVVTREAPEQFYAATDPIVPWRARAAVKIWRDRDAGVDFARVWVPGATRRFTRPSTVDEVLVRRNQGGWVADGPVEEFDGPAPVIVLDREGSEGLIEQHHDLIDRINLGKLNRLVIVAMQAFRQRALRQKEGAPLPETDEAGTPIDYAKVFEPAPGAMWELPEGIDIWESQTTDLLPILEGEKADARDFAAVTRTPISVFIPDGANQSAEGAANATAGQVAQAGNEIRRMKPALEGALVLALRAEGVEFEDATVEVSFAPAAYVSVAERYAAAAQAKAAGEPWKSIARNILGYSPEQIAQADADLAEEQLATATLLAPPAPAPVVTGGAA